MTAGLVLLDGCGDGDRTLATGWTTAGIVVVGTDAGSFGGGYGIRLGQAPANGLGLARRNFADVALPLIGFHWHVVARAGDDFPPGVQLMKDGVVHCNVDLSVDNRVRIFGPAGTQVAESEADALLYGAWYGVEIEAKIHDSTGYVKVYLGGHPDPVVEFTGDTKHASASAVVNQVRWSNGEQQRVYIDDLSVLDLTTGDRLGVTYVLGYSPDDDEETDWTPSTGTDHANLVDEQPFSATDYVSTDGAGNRDRFSIDDAGNIQEVFGARVVGQMQGDSGAQSRLVFSDGSTHEVGTTRSLGAAATYEDVFDEPPGGGAWGSSAGLQMGVECVTGAGPVSRLNSIALELLLKRPPGEVRVTSLHVTAGVLDVPGEVRVTSEYAEFSGSGDPSEVRVTHEYMEFSGGDNPSAARVTHLYVQVMADYVPEAPPLPELQSCDLMLEVFNDDRATVRWSCSTRLDVLNPFLMMPDRYAEQEIDVAEGSATLGTVTVTVVDVPQEAGDQNTGFMTGKLARQAVADVQGRRARLLRAIGTGDDQILEVVIDGVAGTPRMDTSYAAFGFEIRDTREVERKIRCFDGSVEATTALLPHGVIAPYGLNPETGLYLIDAVGPLTGTFNQQNGTYPNPATGSVNLTGNPTGPREIPLKIHQALGGVVDERGQQLIGAAYQWYRTRFQNIAIWWREASSGDPWSVIDGQHLVLDGTASHPRTNLATVTTDLTGDFVRIEWITFGDDRVAPGGLSVPAYSPVNPEAALPAHGQSIELIIVTSGPASKENPVHVEGLTAGEFAKNVYDGVYSARDADGEIVPTGILYDEDAVLAMTDPVRLRIMEPIADARDWLEKYIYAPTGWVPALDIFGRISPVSQEAPEDIYSLPLIYDHITEPAPEWNSGEHIVNVVRFTNYRDYVPDDADNAESLDGLSENKKPLLEWNDPVSVGRNGEQVLEIDGRAFRALGDANGQPVLEDGLQAEEGWRLSRERRDHVLNRYSLGAPTMTVNVRREYTPTLRAGSWVRVWLSWFPDYVTGERGLIALCQIVAIGDLDCVWRMVTMEQVLPLSLYDVDDDLRQSLLIGKTNKFLTGKSGLPLEAIL